jgi:hypothetical protein
MVDVNLSTYLLPHCVRVPGRCVVTRLYHVIYYKPTYRIVVQCYIVVQWFYAN